MEIEKSKFKTYSFTIRKVKLVSVDRDTYRKHLARLPFISVDKIVFEHKGGLHMHGVGIIANHIDKKRFRFRGWHIFLKELWDREGWERYLKKEDDEPDPEDVDIKDDSPLPKKRLFGPINQNACAVFEDRDCNCFELNREIPYDVDTQDEDEIYRRELLADEIDRVRLECAMAKKERGYYPYDPRS